VKTGEDYNVCFCELHHPLQPYYQTFLSTFRYEQVGATDCNFANEANNFKKLRRFSRSKRKFYLGKNIAVFKSITASQNSYNFIIRV